MQEGMNNVGHEGDVNNDRAPPTATGGAEQLNIKVKA